MDALNTSELTMVNSRVETSAEKLFLAMITEIEELEPEQFDNASTRFDSTPTMEENATRLSAELATIKSQCQQQQGMISELQENNLALKCELKQQHDQQQDMISLLQENNSSLKCQVKQHHDIIVELREQLDGLAKAHQIESRRTLCKEQQLQQTQTSPTINQSTLLSDSHQMKQEIETVEWCTDECNEVTISQSTVVVEQHDEPDTVVQPAHSTPLFQDDQSKFSFKMQRATSDQDRKRNRKRIPFNFESIEESSKNPPKRRKYESKTYSCGECKKQFNLKGNLTRHLRIHTGEKPFACKDCDRAFAQPDNLKKHELIHSGVKPFACKDCDRAFTQSGGLKQHQKIHLGEKPFMCDICMKSFRQKLTLSVHMRIHIGIKPHKCNVCMKEFRQKANLLKHLQTHSKGGVLRTLRK